MRRSGACRSSVPHLGFANMFQMKHFFRDSKTRKVQEKPYEGSSLHRRGGDEVIGSIPIANCLVEYQEQVCLSGR